MLMAVNIGNTRISIGFLDDICKVLFQFKIATDVNKTADEYLSVVRSIVREEKIERSQLTGVIIASVVPVLTPVLKEVAFRIVGIEPLVVGAGLKTGFPIRIDSPSELGADIVANTCAVISDMAETITPTVIVDMGTVNTVSAISKNGEYIGCSIFPGIQMSFDVLHGGTAQLPNVTVTQQLKAIGKNSAESLRSGVIIGNAIMLDGFVYRFAKELKTNPDDIRLVITGEYAKYVKGVCKRNFELDEDLTLKGLFHLYKKNTPHN